MTKTKIVLFILFIKITTISINPILSASENGYSQGDTGYITKNFELDMLSTNGNKVNRINTFFCNNGIEESKLTKSLSMVARPGEEKEICIIQFNLDSQDIYSRGSFPESKIVIDRGGRYCNDINDRNNPFAKFIKPFSEKSIKIPAKGYVIRKTTIKFPIGVKGIQYGCFAYGVADTKDTLEGSMISILVRKVNNINILVEGKKYTEREKIKDKIIKNKYIIFDFLFLLVFILIVITIINLFKKKH